MTDTERRQPRREGLTWVGVLRVQRSSTAEEHALFLHYVPSAPSRTATRHLFLCSHCLLGPPDHWRNNRTGHTLEKSLLHSQVCRALPKLFHPKKCTRPTCSQPFVTWRTSAMLQQHEQQCASAGAAPQPPLLPSPVDLAAAATPVHATEIGMLRAQLEQCTSAAEKATREAAVAAQLAAEESAAAAELRDTLAAERAAAAAAIESARAEEQRTAAVALEAERQKHKRMASTPLSGAENAPGEAATASPGRRRRALVPCSG